MQSIRKNVSSFAQMILKLKVAPEITYSKNTLLCAFNFSKFEYSVNLVSSAGLR
jgi:hypothetical protein